MASGRLDGRRLGFDRLLFFSDAVFAIAITLLVLDLRVPDDAHAPFDLTPLIPRFAAFGVSFYVIGRYWMAHHSLFEGVAGYDGRLLGANLAFLAAIVFLPFPTSVVTHWRPAPGPVAFYALSLATVGFAMVALTLVARRPKLLAAGETHGGTAARVVNAAASPAVFLVTASAALLDAEHALALILLLAPASWVAGRLGERLRRRLDHAAGSQAGSATTAQADG